jgi:hypothetical protein
MLTLLEVKVYRAKHVTFSSKKKELLRAVGLSLYMHTTRHININTIIIRVVRALDAD